MSKINRFGVSIEKDLLRQFDNLIKDKYNNRSEAIRDMIREKLIEDKLNDNLDEIVGSITLLYNHHKNGLTEKMLEIQHKYHHLFQSNLHLHLNHDCCLEIIVVKGKAKELKNIAGKLIGLKGVKHGKLVLSSIDDF